MTEPVPPDLLPPPIVRVYLKRRYELLLHRVKLSGWIARVSPSDASTIRAWINAMNEALASPVLEPLSQCFGATWIEDESMDIGTVQIEIEGEIV